MQIAAIKSNFKFFESALYMKSVSMPLIDDLRISPNASGMRANIRVLVT